MSTTGRAVAGRLQVWVIGLLVLIGLVVVLLLPLGPAVAAVVALVVGVRAARRRSQRLLAVGLELLAGAPVGFAVFFLLQLASVAGGPVALLHGLAVAACAAGLASLVAGIAVLTVVWARSSGQRTGPVVTAAATVGALVAASVLWWAWGRAFAIADAGGSTTAYDAVLRVSGLALLACVAVGLVAAGVTLVRSRR